MSAEPLTVLRGATVEGRGVVDVHLRGELIERIVPHQAADPAGTGEPVESVDLSGHVLLPAAVEPHAHLDKALLWSRAANPGGDLAGAIDAHHRVAGSIGAADVRDRALAALQVAVRRGYTAVRSHVNVEQEPGTCSLEALLGVREEVAEAVDLDLAAMVGLPVTGEAGRANRDLLDRALELGADLVGGAPWLDDRPHEAVDLLVGAAAAAGRGVDLHLDETLDDRMLAVRTFARAVERHGLGGRATASHCVSLGQQTEEEARSVAAVLREVGIAVVTLPQTNLGLQARGVRTRAPRATAPVQLLREAGVTVAGGGDNWRDMFNPVGRIDPLETAALLVAACHVSPAEAYLMTSAEAAVVTGRPRRTVEEGAPAELLAVRADDVAGAVADATEHRTVVHRGRVVARTEVTHRPVRNWPDM
ncbi:amidohydrolase family protein [Nocardioides marmoribigeumensis]|uniref:Cytosine deaminase n=1 Tax=Nocardioides marmoribigeumensis TaxID=433649 RepID=A0ABU2BUV7_9ACTN|nr:amidohydrolase family protein [Nocardioides marmoribigeumensis]MDR7362422.1 cytosine deaminase [Nocardioides marmoribigeumensis]